MPNKTAPVQIKAVGTDDGLDDGQFEAIVAVFGSEDLGGDVVEPGAFKDTLAEWKASGDPIPIYWSHRMDDPEYNIGHVLDAKEVDRGLWVKGQIDQDTADDNRKALRAYKLMKGRRVTQFSWSYTVTDGGFVDRDGKSFYQIRKVKVHEVGPTPVGLHPDTELLAVKSADMTAAVQGLAEAGDLDALRKARALIDDVLAADGGEAGNTPDGKATGDEPANDETREGKSEEPTRPSAADLSEIQSIELAAVEAAGATSQE